MRLSALLIAAFCMLHVAGMSQTITFSGKNVPLTKVFEVIEQQTNYVISGDRELVTSSQPITVSADKMPLFQFLSLVLGEQGIAFIPRQRNIFVYRPQAPGGPKLPPVTPNPVTHIPPVTGTIHSRNGELLTGVSVKVKGKQYGTTTDAQGTFRIPMPDPNFILQISSIGYEPLEVVIRDGGEFFTAAAVKPEFEDNVKLISGPVSKALPKQVMNLEIILETSTNQMNQVIVNGYSNINKSNFTGSAVTIRRDELLKVAPSNVLKSLQIFDPSFKVLDNNSLGSDPNNINPVYIRGRSGIGDVTLPDDAAALSPMQLRNDPNLPTFILDGYEVPAQRIFDLDPTRVESITILKDAASTAIYGSRAANGVVVVETVKPVSGKLRVNYALNGSVTAPDLSAYHLLNAREKLELEKITGVFERRQNDQPSDALAREQTYYGKLAEINRGVETDWLSQPLRTGLNQRHNILVEGGSKEFIFGADLNFARTQGVMKGSERDNNSIGFSISYRKNNLMFRNYIQWNNIQSQESPFGAFATYAEQNPYDAFLDDEGNYKKLLTDWGHPGTPGNPLYDAHLNSYNRTRSNDFSNNFNLKWTIADGLRLDTRLAVMLQKSQQQNFKDPASSQFEGMDFNKKGTKSILDDELRTWDFNALLQYGKGRGKHYLNTTIGANAAQKEMSRSGYAVQGFLTGNTDDINFAADVLDKPTGDDEKSRLLGLMASANYSYDNIYLLDLSGRYDGASQFGSNVRFAPFWSVGGGINLHNYAGVKENYPWLTNLKVRANYGQVGKAGFSQSVSKSTYRYNFEDWYAFGIGANLVTLANPNLKWEKTYMFDYGVDLTVFNRFSITFNYYNKKTVDLIGDITLPFSTGFKSYKSNLGEILNEGYELSARYQVLNSRKVNLSLYATAAHNSNKFLKIGDALKEYNKRVEEYYDAHKFDGISKPLNKYYEGASQTAIYAMRSLGINPADGREIFLDRNGDVTYTWNETQHVVVGDTEPDWRGAFGFNLTYKSFFIFTGFLYEVGGDMYNSTLVSKVENANVYKNVDSRVFSDRWQKPGDVTYLKDVKLWNEVTQVTSRFVQRNNYIDFNSITIGYDLPQRLISKWSLNTCRVQLTSNDLGRISSIDIERGTDYPYARTVNFTINLGF